MDSVGIPTPGCVNHHLQSAHYDAICGHREGTLWGPGVQKQSVQFQWEQSVTQCDVTTDVTCPCRSLHYCSTSCAQRKRHRAPDLWQNVVLAWWIWYMWSGWTSAGRRDWTDDIVFFFCNHWCEITYRKKNPQFINDTISKVIQLKLNLMSSELKKNLYFSVIDHHSLKRSCDPRVITTETCEYSRDFIVTRLSRLAPRSV